MDELLALPELGSVLLLSLQATSRTNATQVSDGLRATAGGEPDLERSPGFRKLVEEIIFSRRFILTYYLVVLLIVAVFSAGHWYNRYTRWKGRSKPAGAEDTVDEHGSSTASSSSSTLQGSRSPTLEDDWKKKVDE